MSLNINFKNPQTQWIVLALLLGAGALVAYVNLLLMPTIAGLSEINPELADLRVNIEETERWIRMRSNQERRLEELKAEVTNCATISSAEEEVPSLLEELSKMAHNADVKIMGIRPEKIDSDGRKRKSPLEEIPISIKARCGYHRLGHFISKLENAGRVFVIRDIKIAGRSQNPKSHDVNLVVSTFLLSEE